MESTISVGELLDKQENKTILAIYPHPDDETIFCGGLLGFAHKKGFKTHVFILTQGGAGQMHVHPKGKTIKQIRKAELECACEALGVDKLIVGDFEDSKLKEQKKLWTIEVEKVIKQINPGIIVTYDHSGITGHPDHIVLSVELFNLVKKKFPKTVLLWSTLPKNIFTNFFNKSLCSCLSKPTHYLDMKYNIVSKFRSACSYKSQRFGPVFIHPNITIFLMLLRFKKEWYHLVDLNKEYFYKFVKFDI